MFLHWSVGVDVFPIRSQDPSRHSRALWSILRWGAPCGEAQRAHEGAWVVGLIYLPGATLGWYTCQVDHCFTCLLFLLWSNQQKHQHTKDWRWTFVSHGRIQRYCSDWITSGWIGMYQLCVSWFFKCICIGLYVHLLHIYCYLMSNFGKVFLQNTPKRRASGMASGPGRNVQIHGMKIWRSWRRWWKRPSFWCENFDEFWCELAEKRSLICWMPFLENAEFRNKWIWEGVHESENDESKVIRRYLYCIVSRYYFSFFPIRAWFGAWHICSPTCSYIPVNYASLSKNSSRHDLPVVCWSPRWRRLKMVLLWPSIATRGWSI